MPPFCEQESEKPLVLNNSFCLKRPNNRHVCVFVIPPPLL
jgi:hypothetical protein